MLNLKVYLHNGKLWQDSQAWAAYRQQEACAAGVNALVGRGVWHGAGDDGIVLFVPQFLGDKSFHMFMVQWWRLITITNRSIRYEETLNRWHKASLNRECLLCCAKWSGYNCLKFLWITVQYQCTLLPWQRRLHQSTSVHAWSQQHRMDAAPVPVTNVSKLNTRSWLTLQQRHNYTSSSYSHC